MADNLETLITLEGFDRPRRRRFTKLAEKFGMLNGTSPDGKTIRILSTSIEMKNFLEAELKKLPDFEGVGKIKITA